MNPRPPLQDQRPRQAAERTRGWVFTLALLALLALIFFLPFATAGAATGEVVELRAGASTVDLSRAVTYFVDSGDEMSLAAVRAALTEGRFATPAHFPPTFGFADGTYWLHLRVRNVDSHDPDWLLVIQYALLDDLQLNVVHADGRVDRSESGDRLPFTQRAVAHRDPSFALAAQIGESVDLLLRVRTQSSVQIPVRLVTSRQFLAEAPGEHLGLGAYYGVMLGLFLYNLILWLSVRDRTYLYYILYVGSFALGQFCLNGLAFQYLWPEAPDWANSAVIVTIAMGMIAMLAFSNAYLELRRTFPAASRIMTVLIGTLTLATLAYPSLGYRRTILIVTFHVFPIAAIILTAAVRTLMTGYRPARNFLLAWVALLIGVVAYAALSFGLLPKIFLTEYGIQLGSAAEMILLSFALAYRINTLTADNQRLQLEATAQLEARVAARTHELDQAMHQLRAANQTLRDYSLRDGLTGVHNRRYFDQALSESWEYCRRTGQPLSLLMVDIDHFKQINDRHGHLAGDDCLCATAQAISRQLRHPDERLVRYGGEEFVMILPGSDQTDAINRAEAVRNAASELAVNTEGTQIRLTVSLGTATFDATEEFAQADLLRITDRALYDAKRLGRNRVATGSSSKSGT